MATKTKNKSKAAEPKILDTVTAVMYCDGGAGPGNPGPAGYGVHVYFWDTHSVNINAFRKNKRAGKAGYVEDTVEESGRVVPFNILNASGVVSPHHRATNNVAELVACIRGLNEVRTYSKTLDKPLAKLHIRSDSEYMLDKLKAISSTKKENRRGVLLRPNRMGQPRPNQNETIDLLNAYERLEADGTAISFKWVKGHNGEVGNELADKFASFGKYQAGQLMSRSRDLLPKKTNEHVVNVDPVEFWSKNETELPPLVFHTNAVYSNCADDYVPLDVTIDGVKYHAYLFSSEADEYREEKKAPPNVGVDEDEEEENEESVINELAGDNVALNSDYPKVAGRLGHYKARTSRAIVYLKEPLPILDELMGLYANNDALRDFVLNDIILFKLNMVNNQTFKLGYSICGTDHIEIQDNALNRTVYPLARASLMFDGEYLALHVGPQKVSLYILEHLSDINNCAMDYFNGSQSIASIEDITGLFYDIDPEGQTKLKQEIKVGYRRTEHVHKTFDEDKNPVDVKLVLVNGIHLPDRNALKRLEEFAPKIKLVTKILGYMPNSFCSYMFYIVIESDIGFGFYMAEISNLVIVSLTS